MDSRLELHEIFCEIINITESDGDRHAYFDPPASVKMRYPAIRYVRKPIEAIHANDATYKKMRCYEVTVIQEDPDGDIHEKVLALPYCRHDRAYKADNLNHDVLTIYYK